MTEYQQELCRNIEWIQHQIDATNMGLTLLHGNAAREHQDHLARLVTARNKAQAALETSK